MNYIILIGAFQALISFALSFVHKRGISGNALSWLLALIFLHLGGNFFINIAFPQSETHKQFNTFIALFYGPALWMYVAPISGVMFRRQLSNYLHMIPGVIAAAAYFSIAAYAMAHAGKAPPVIYYYNLITGCVTVFSLSFYGIRCWLRAQYITSFWDEERQLVRLISGLFLGIALVWFPFQLFFYFSPTLLPADTVFYWLRIFVYLMLLTICLAIVRVKVLVIKYTDTVVQPEATEGQEQVRKRQALSAGQHVAIAGDIRRMMEEAKLFTNPELTLDNLAAAMEISRNHLSEVLNQHIGRSFYQYVNEYRIQQVVNLMNRCKKEQVAPNILSLAFEAGFHTKSSFNQYFKKVVGCTPSAYMKTEVPVFLFSPGAEA